MKISTRKYILLKVNKNKYRNIVEMSKFINIIINLNRLYYVTIVIY